MWLHAIAVAMSRPHLVMVLVWLIVDGVDEQLSDSRVGSISIIRRQSH